LVAETQTTFSIERSEHESAPDQARICERQSALMACSRFGSYAASEV
jgi:hypothetical protein